MAAQDSPTKDSVDPPGLRLVKILVWPVVVLVLGFSALYMSRGYSALQEISVGNMGTFKFYALAAAQDRPTLGASGASAAAAPPPAFAVSQVSALADNAAKAKLQGRKVLWVDDNPQNQSYEKSALAALGIQFDTALSTREALEKLMKGHYDLVISDFARRDDPQGGGTLVDDLKKMKDAPPVIIYSAGWTPELEAQMKARGAYGETNQVLTLFQMVIDALQQGRA